MPRGSAPEKIKAEKPRHYLEVMTKAVFQSGISWKVIEAKWPGFKEAFFDFDPKKIAKLGPKEVDELAADTRIVRNRRKIEATIDNAVEILALEKEFGSIRAYLRSHKDFDSTVADLKKRFRFMGDTGAYFFLYCVGERVPSHEEWAARRQAR